MTSNVSRREARRQFKARTPDRGAFAVRCQANGRVWVGASTNLFAAKNGMWAALRMGAHRDPGLQADWNTFGEAAFRFDVLETLDEDVVAIAVSDLLKEKKRHWAGQLGASTLL